MIKKKNKKSNVTKNKAFNGGSMILPKLPAYFLFAAIIWVAYQLLIVVQPFMMILIFSAIIATVTYPIYIWMGKKLNKRLSTAAFLTSLLVMMVIVIPLILFLLILAGQAVDLYNIVNKFIHNVDFDGLTKWQPGNWFYDVSGTYSKEIGILIQNNLDSFKNGLTESAKTISSFAARQSAEILTQVGLTMFNILLMSFSLFFFYRDGKIVLQKLMILSPIPIKYEKILFLKFSEISRATLYGTFLTSLAQGLVAWLGFMIAGVPNAFFWGAAVIVCSLVPSVGTGLVWLPMGIMMLISGNIWGLFILLWGAGLVGTIDNVLRVVLIGNSTKLNPLLTFVAVFGGILAFGLIGVIFGPMLLVLFLTLLHIYEIEYAELLGKPKNESFLI